MVHLSHKSTLHFLLISILYFFKVLGKYHLKFPRCFKCKKCHQPAKLPFYDRTCDVTKGFNTSPSLVTSYRWEPLATLWLPCFCPPPSMRKVQQDKSVFSMTRLNVSIDGCQHRANKQKVHVSWRSNIIRTGVATLLFNRILLALYSLKWPTISSALLISAALCLQVSPHHGPS